MPIISMSPYCAWYWQPYGSATQEAYWKRDRVAQRHVGRIIYTNPDLVYGATSCQRLFRDTVNYAKGFYTAANSRDPFSWQWKANGCFTTLCNGLPDTATSILFPAMCHCLYRFIVAGYATYLQRVLLYSFLSHTQHVYFLELRSKRYPEWHGSLLVHLGNDVCQPSTRNDRVMRVGSRNPQIHLSDGWSRHTDLVHQE